MALQSSYKPTAPTFRSAASLARRFALALGLGLLVAAQGGCNIVAMFGAMEESRRKDSTHEIKAEYTSMEDKRWAVVVMADRGVQADNPQLVDKMTADLTRRLIDGGVGKDAALPEDVLRFMYNNPRWVTMTYGELSQKLGVQRLIVVEILEYRLYDVGNKYLYNGRAKARIGVVEADSAIPDELAFQKQVEVKFPKKDGMGVGDLPAAAVNTELARRLMTRTSWYFFDHQEPYYPEF